MTASLAGAGSTLEAPGVLDGGDDVGVGAAAADVAAHLLADLGVRAGVPFGEQADPRADLAGGAVAALKGVAVDERLLERVQPVALRQALDRRDPGAGVHDGEREAGVDAPPVDQDGAGAALAVVAALLGPGQAEVLAQRVQQRGPPPQLP